MSLQHWRELTPDGRLLFSTRIARLFAYGFLSVVLVLYLAEAGLTEPQIGALLTLTLIGDTLISLWITTTADRVGRKRMLIAGAGLMLFAGGLFAVTRNFGLLLGAALGGVAQSLRSAGASPLESYRAVVVGYAIMGLVLGAMFTRLSLAVEAPPLSSSGRARPPQRSEVDGAGGEGRLGLHRSRGVVFKLSALFAMDAFGGGFVVQSLVAYWFHRRFGVGPAVLGGIFFGANLLAGLSGLAAGRGAARIGLINTMVFSHIPSNILLMLVPLMPSLPLAIAVLLLRFSISQMDVPTRQSYTMAMVAPDERSAAAGVTGVARTLGASLAPIFTGPLLAHPALMGVPFLLSGGLKIIYDLTLYREFRALRPP